MINSNGKLEIFENFRVDHDLPKFRKPEVNGPDDGNEYGMMNSFAASRMSIMSSDSSGLVVFQSGDKPEGKSAPLSWWKKLFAKKEPKPAPEPVPELSVQDFFKSVKNSTEELAVVTERATGYESALRKAIENGQTALKERLDKMVLAVRAETQLVALDMAKYLEEDTLVEFVKKSPKGLRLDRVANFTRVIPDDIYAKKKLADERGVFDNYCVLHYDPQGKSWAETHAEVQAKKKDPILFGLIEGRRRLYYVGDWVDEFCDLTLDQIADAMGKEKVLEISKTVKGAE